jgi:hypothetical protein
MTRALCRTAFVLGLAALGWAGTGPGGVVTPAHAIIGRPATPVSYAGVARRSTVGVGAPGVGAAPGVGVGAPGVGAAPANRGGPVNRVGVR